MKKRTIKSLSRSQIYSIALAYSQGTYTYCNFCDEYPDFSANQFYSILHTAVNKAIVPQKIARNMQQVAVLAAVQRATKNGLSTDSIEAIKYKVYNSWENRINNLKVFQFSRKEAKKIAEQYANSLLTKYEFCKQNCISTKLFDNTLTNAIINNWVSDETFNLLYEKAMEYQNYQQVEALFYYLAKKRNEQKSKTLNTSQ